jgi:hypothetical protein
MTEAAPLLGLLAGLVGIANTLPYVRDTLARSTCPHRGSWLIWTVLALVAFASQRADGASWSLIMTGVQAVTNGLIFVLAIRRGTGGLGAADALLIGIAGAGLGSWALLDHPVAATASVIVADVIGVVLMVPKTWEAPESETLSTFAGASVSGALGAAAVGAAAPSLLIYPAYYCLANGALALLIVRRRAVIAAQARARGPSSSRAVERSFGRPRASSIRA